jgi:hypothetical protein
MKSAVFVLSASLMLAGCTVKPMIVRPATPSLDSGIANSGVIQILPGYRYLVTPLFNERYEALVKLYGAKLIPPMTSPRWITASGTNYIITSDGIEAFAEMDFYARQHQSP